MSQTLLQDRTLPHAVDVERSLLGAILLSADAWSTIASAITSADFYRDAHARIFGAMTRLIERGVSVDFLVLKNELERVGELDEVGGPAYIASFVDGMPRNANVSEWAAIVKEKARLRGLIFAANKVLSAAYEAESTASQIIESGVTSLMSFTDVSAGAPIKAVDAMMAYVTSLDNKDQAGALQTGFTDLDLMLAGGLKRQELTVLAGRPSSGKSSLGLGIAKAVALAGGPSVFFSLEMRAQALGARLVSWGARVDRARVTGGFLGERDYARISVAIGEMVDVGLYVQDAAATLTEVSAWVDRMKREHGIVCVVIDYLQMLIPDKRSASRQEDVAAISRGLKRLAKQHDIAVVALSSLNRSPEERKDNRPRLSDLRESGSIEFDTDVALLLYRADQYDKSEETRGIAEVIVAKSREGPTGTVKLAFMEEYGGLFANLAVGY